jgi:hypothetical protein
MVVVGSMLICISAAAHTMNRTTSWGPVTVIAGLRWPLLPVHLVQMIYVALDYVVAMALNLVRPIAL